MAPPRPPPVTFTEEVPCSSDASSMKYDGIIEKSVMPSMGELIFMPFHVTCVCDGDVPRKDAVESVARPYCLMKTVELNVRASASERAMLSCSTAESRWVRCTPICFMGRAAETSTCSMSMV